MGGQVHFWTTFVGVNLTFFPQHFLGLPACRAAIDYPEAFAYLELCMSSIGAFISAALRPCSSWRGDLHACSLAARWRTIRGAIGATTLEWTLSSPPPFHTFNDLPQMSPSEAHH